MKVERDNGKATVYPQGRIDIANSQDLKDTLLGLMDEGVKKVHLDFGNVNGIDSSGLGKLLLFQKKLQEENGELTIGNVASEYVKKIFSLVHLYKVIKIEGLSD